MNATVVSGTSAALVAASVYPAPTTFTRTSLNVATPATAATESVPAGVVADGFAASPSATVPVNAVAVAPTASIARTTIAGVSATPAT